VRTFSVKNFDRFQHYKDRSPPWIKLYNELLDDYEFGLLPDATKMHLVAIWLLASRSENKIPYDPAWVARRINANDPVDLGLLAARGFILVDQELHKPEQVASAPIAKRLPREETQVQDIEQKIGGGEERAREPSKNKIGEEAFETSTAVLAAMGLPFDHPLSVGAPLTIQGWLNEHWNPECIIVGVKRAMQNRPGDPPSTLKYFEKAIARAHAELTPKLPMVEIRETPKITVTNYGTSQANRSGGSLIDSLKRDLVELQRPESPDHQMPDSSILRLSR
jgi:hypothetical protein